MKFHTIQNSENTLDEFYKGDWDLGYFQRKTLFTWNRYTHPIWNINYSGNIVWNKWRALFIEGEWVSLLIFSELNAKMVFTKTSDFYFSGFALQLFMFMLMQMFAPLVCRVIRWYCFCAPIFLAKRYITCMLVGLGFKIYHFVFFWRDFSLFRFVLKLFLFIECVFDGS